MWHNSFQQMESAQSDRNANDSGISSSPGSRNSLVLNPTKYEDDHCEPLVQFRNRSIAQKARLSNRHSYHAGVNPPTMVGIPPERFSYNPLSTFYLPIAHGISGTSRVLHTQHSTEDFDVNRSSKNNKRYSANFALNVVGEDLNMNSVNSSDSLTSRQHVDTMQQGPELQDSPRSSNAAGPTMKRDEVGKAPMSQMIHQGGIPIQGQVLIDPTTGQHYIVPQAAFYQPVQPMYFPQNTAPMYYPGPYGQPAPQGYPVMQPAPSQSPYGAVPVSHSSFHPQQRYPAGQSVRYAASTVSAEENQSARSYEDRKYEQIPPQSPTHSSHHFPASVSPYGSQSQVTSFAPQYRQPPYAYASNTARSRGSPNSQPEDPENSRDSFRRDASRSSAEFSARSSGEFRRQGSGSDFPREVDLQRQGSGEFSFQRPREGGDSQRSQGSQDRTPLYGGPPQWWGRGRQEGDSLTDVDSVRTQQTSPPSNFAASDSEAMRNPLASHQTHRAPPSRPVRMDIDFSKPMGEEVEVKSKESPSPSLTPTSRSAIRLDFDFSKTMPEELELLEKAKAVPRVPATAFTVTFDSPNESVSLQDAARKSAQARRVLSRKAPPTAGSSAPNQQMTPVAPEPSNKKYLLSKLLNGSSSNSEVGADVPDISDVRDHDMISEAGTFVVARSKGPAQSRIIEDSDSSTDSESDSGPSRDASPVRQSARSPRNDDMLKGLCHLRQSVGIKPPTAVRTAAPQPSVPIRPSRAPMDIRPATSVLPPLSKRSSIGVQPSASPAPSSVTSRSVAPPTSGAMRVAPPSPSANNFRRGDGGRFSMRGGPQSGIGSGAQSSVGSTANTRPPFRAGGAPVRPSTGNPQQQREQEMNAWLRRKDYNPMKAAAEAKKAKETKSRGDQFVSNRSISFHIGPAAMPRRQNEMAELSRNRSEESLATEDAEQASQRIVAEYSRGVVQDINRLSQQTRGSGKQLSGLSRAVDMLSQKCKKSIELIRSQNKGCLSVSVEDLLAAAAEPPRMDESVDEQLERLSDAFDAVQRYLEQYSLDGHQSPIPEFDEEAETNSMVSGFSGFSIRSREPRAMENNTRSSIGSVGASSIGTPRSTIGYRSRILAGASSPNRKAAPEAAPIYDEDETY